MPVIIGAALIDVFSTLLAVNKLPGDLLTRPKTPRPLHPIQYRPTIRVAGRRRIAIPATATRLLAQRSGSAAGLRPRARPENVRWLISPV